MEQIEVRPSRNGRGAFATIPIAQGVVVWDWSDGRIYTQDQLPVPYVTDAYLQVAENLYVGPDDSGDPEKGLEAPGDFINHSCEPNCAVRASRGDDGWLILVVALRDIGVGEEITYDYAATMFKDSWEIACNCGASRCRKVIREPR